MAPLNCAASALAKLFAPEPGSDDLTYDRAMSRAALDQSLAVWPEGLA